MCSCNLGADTHTYTDMFTFGVLRIETLASIILRNHIHLHRWRIVQNVVIFVLVDYFNV